MNLIAEKYDLTVEDWAPSSTRNAKYNITLSFQSLGFLSSLMMNLLNDRHILKYVSLVFCLVQLNSRFSNTCSMCAIDNSDESVDTGFIFLFLLTAISQ